MDGLPARTSGSGRSSPDYYGVFSSHVEQAVDVFMDRIGDRLGELEYELRYAWRAVDLLSQEYVRMWEKLERLEILLYEQQNVIAQLLAVIHGNSDANPSRPNHLVDLDYYGSHLIDDYDMDMEDRCLVDELSYSDEDPSERFARQTFHEWLSQHSTSLHRHSTLLERLEALGSSGQTDSPESSDVLLDEASPSPPPPMHASTFRSAKPPLQKRQTLRRWQRIDEPFEVADKMLKNLPSTATTSTAITTSIAGNSSVVDGNISNKISSDLAMMPTVTTAISLSATPKSNVFNEVYSATDYVNHRSSLSAAAVGDFSLSQFDKLASHLKDVASSISEPTATIVSSAILTSATSNIFVKNTTDRILKSVSSSATTSAAITTSITCNSSVADENISNKIPSALETMPTVTTAIPLSTASNSESNTINEVFSAADYVNHHSSSPSTATTDFDLSQFDKLASQMKEVASSISDQSATKPIIATLTSDTNSQVVQNSTKDWLQKKLEADNVLLIQEPKYNSKDEKIVNDVESIATQSNHLTTNASCPSHSLYQKSEDDHKTEVTPTAVMLDMRVNTRSLTDEIERQSLNANAPSPLQTGATNVLENNVVLAHYDSGDKNNRNQLVETPSTRSPSLTHEKRDSFSSTFSASFKNPFTSIMRQLKDVASSISEPSVTTPITTTVTSATSSVIVKNSTKEWLQKKLEADNVLLIHESQYGSREEKDINDVTNISTQATQNNRFTANATSASNSLYEKSENEQEKSEDGHRTAITSTAAQIDAEPSMSVTDDEIERQSLNSSTSPLPCVQTGATNAFENNAMSAHYDGSEKNQNQLVETPTMRSPSLTLEKRDSVSSTSSAGFQNRFASIMRQKLEERSKYATINSSTSVDMSTADSSIDSTLPPDQGDEMQQGVPKKGKTKWMAAVVSDFIAFCFLFHFICKMNS